jgi:hypothetical protein
MAVCGIALVSVVIGGVVYFLSAGSSSENADLPPVEKTVPKKKPQTTVPAVKPTEATPENGESPGQSTEPATPPPVAETDAAVPINETPSLTEGKPSVPESEPSPAPVPDVPGDVSRPSSAVAPSVDSGKTRKMEEEQRSRQAKQQLMVQEFDALIGIMEKAKKSGRELIREETIRFFNAYPEELPIQLKVIEKMKALQIEDTAASLCREWQEQNPKLSNGLYLASLWAETDEERGDLLAKAVAAKPFLDAAFRDYSAIISAQGDRAALERFYEEWLSNSPLDRDVCRRLADLKIERGLQEAGVLRVQQILQSRDVSRSEIAARLVFSAQQLPSKALAEGYALDLKGDSSHFNEYELARIRNKAIYGTLSEEDFAEGFYPSEVRYYHMLFLLSKNRESEVTRIPTPPADFPDFWKVYIAWRNEDSIWQELCERLLARHEKDERSFIPLIARVWLKQVDPDTARKEIDSLRREDQPIARYLLAEVFQKQKVRTKASVLYQSALRETCTPYHFFIKSREPQF